MSELKNSYEEARNALIPFAERFANEKEGAVPGISREEWVTAWNIAFLGEMDRLNKEQNTREAT